MGAHSSSEERQQADRGVRGTLKSREHLWTPVQKDAESRIQSKGIAQLHGSV